jgi:hypothetical protein
MLVGFDRITVNDLNDGRVNGTAGPFVRES